MRILIFGGSGMLGHKVMDVLSKAGHEVLAPAREELDATWDGWILRDELGERMEAWGTQVVINAAGIVKSRVDEFSRDYVLLVNSVFPHILADLCNKFGFRLIHISTDCVFSGNSFGAYREDCHPDPADFYGKSKLAGEPDYGVTLRASFIGRELAGRRNGLLEWFLSQNGGSVQGFSHVWFTGMTTLELAKVTRKLIEEHPGLSGLYHVAAPAITKYDLLCLLRDAYGLSVKIFPTRNPYCARYLHGEAFRRATGWEAPTWKSMIADMLADPYPYEPISS